MELKTPLYDAACKGRRQDGAFGGYILPVTISNRRNQRAYGSPHTGRTV